MDRWLPGGALSNVNQKGDSQVEETPMVCFEVLEKSD